MILVVEDHEETRWVLLRLLERNGHRTFGVADGAAALQFLSEQPPPSLIVLDQGLPHADGLTVLRSIRNDARHQATPVILYTAAATRAVADAAQRLGATELVAKCGDWTVLLDAVERHAGAGAARDDGARPAAPASAAAASDTRPHPHEPPAPRQTRLQ